MSYDNWLYFFNSSLTEITVKDKKEKQEINKEILDDGGIKISGTKPNEWSVLLEPAEYSNIYKILENIKHQKLKAQSLFKEAFRKNKKDLFEEAEKIILSLENKENDINTVIKENKVLEKKINDKIFDIKRKIFLSKKIDIKLMDELKNSLKEKQNILNKINDNINNYPIKSKSIKTKGSVPEPPIINSLDVSVRKTKRQFQKNIDNSELFSLGKN
jgi:hypothetical protein